MGVIEHWFSRAFESESVGVFLQFVKQKRFNRANARGDDLSRWRAEQVRIFVDKRENTTRFGANDGDAARGEVCESTYVELGELNSFAEQSLANGCPSATPCAEAEHLIARVFEKFDGCDADLRREVVGPGVHEVDDCAV